MRNRIVWTAAVLVLMTGCASKVRLDEPASINSVTGSISSSGTPPLEVEQALFEVDPILSSSDNGGVVTLEDKWDINGMPVSSGNVVYFDYDSYAVRPDARPVVEYQARLLLGNKDKKIVLAGHSDERGGREYNLALGQKRAEAVQRMLLVLGVEPQQVESISFGEEKPAVEGSDDLALAKNRRVEFTH